MLCLEKGTWQEHVGSIHLHPGAVRMHAKMQWLSAAERRCAGLQSPGGCKRAECQPVALQIADAVWMSMLLSAFAGILAVTVVVATFYFIRCPPRS